MIEYDRLGPLGASSDVELVREATPSTSGASPSATGSTQTASMPESTWAAKKLTVPVGTPTTPSGAVTVAVSGKGCGESTAASVWPTVTTGAGRLESVVADAAAGNVPSAATATSGSAMASCVRRRRIVARCAG